jgi:regulator of sigma E protease
MAEIIFTVALFILVLFVLILVHEWGHFIAAKKTGMRVDEFGIGFPPRLFSFKKGETEYSFNALPFGGFVRIYGEQNDGESAENEAIPEDRSRAMNNKPLWAQAFVLVSGVAMNIILAWILFVAVFLIGAPAVVDEAVASPAAQLHVARVLPEGPLSGRLPEGAIITGVRSQETVLKTLTPSSLTAFVQEHAETEITISYQMGGVAGEVSALPALGIVADDPERPAIGVFPVLVDINRHDIFSAVLGATERTADVLVAIVVGIATLIADSVRGTADLSQVAGPVGIASLVADAAAFGLASLLSFTAIISLNLAIINLLPVPALDGGRLIFVAIEAATRRPVPSIWAYRLNTFGFVFLIALMLLVTYNDIVRFF